MNIKSLRTPEGNAVVLNFIKSIIPKDTLNMLDSITYENLCTLQTLHSRNDGPSERTKRSLLNDSTISKRLFNEIDVAALDSYVENRKIKEVLNKEKEEAIHQCTICTTRCEKDSNNNVVRGTVVRDSLYSLTMAGRKMFAKNNKELRSICQGCYKRFKCSNDGCGCYFYNGVGYSTYCKKCSFPSFDVNNPKRCSHCKQLDREKRQQNKLKTPIKKRNKKFRRTPVRHQDFMYYEVQKEIMLKNVNDFDLERNRSELAKETFLTGVKNTYHYTLDTVSKIFESASNVFANGSP
eukprot:g7392.t1